MMKGLFKLSLLVVLIFFTDRTTGQDKLMVILREELNANFEQLSEQELPPYLMSYRAVDRLKYSIVASFGVISSNQILRDCSVVPQIRLGNYDFDNFKYENMGSQDGHVALLPIGGEDPRAAISQALWDITNERYLYAEAAYKRNQTRAQVENKVEDRAPCYSESHVEKHYDAPYSDEDLYLDGTYWESVLKDITAVFDDRENFIAVDAILDYDATRRYYVNTEGTEIIQNLPYVLMTVSAVIKADDGMELPMLQTYFAYTPDSLPSREVLLADAKVMCEKLKAMRSAPIVDSYTGPAILSGDASGVFFHEIFGHRIEGLRLKSNADAQTFKNMVNKKVLAETLSVTDDPTLTHYGGCFLNGYYKFDDEGVKAERVDVVKDGKLQEFLMTRTPIDNHPKSNGHARASDGFDAISRQSNLIISTKDPKSDAELRELLIGEVKKQGREYGFFFKKVTGGFTFTGKEGINSFNVTPLEVYRVYADGRADELVRGVDMIGTPLSMFSNILSAGGEVEVFTGLCGAESGQIPVTAISPAILVSKVELQRNDKSKNTPPILPHP